MTLWLGGVELKNVTNKMLDTSKFRAISAQLGLGWDWGWVAVLVGAELSNNDWQTRPTVRLLGMRSYYPANITHDEAKQIKNILLHNPSPFLFVRVARLSSVSNVGRFDALSPFSSCCSECAPSPWITCLSVWCLSVCPSHSASDEHGLLCLVTI